MNPWLGQTRVESIRGPLSFNTQCKFRFSILEFGHRVGCVGVRCNL
jgi:hypothetical protein